MCLRNTATGCVRNGAKPIMTASERRRDRPVGNARELEGGQLRDCFPITRSPAFSPGIRAPRCRRAPGAGSGSPRGACQRRSNAGSVRGVSLPRDSQIETSANLRRIKNPYGNCCATPLFLVGDLGYSSHRITLICPTLHGTSAKIPVSITINSGSTAFNFRRSFNFTSAGFIAVGRCRWTTPL